jgi:hypothetical protein
MVTVARGPISGREEEVDEVDEVVAEEVVAFSEGTSTTDGKVDTTTTTTGLRRLQIMSTTVPMVTTAMTTTTTIIWTICT